MRLSVASKGAAVVCIVNTKAVRLWEYPEYPEWRIKPEN
jgi:hypothetical protein